MEISMWKIWFLHWSFGPGLFQNGYNENANIEYSCRGVSIAFDMTSSFFFNYSHYLLSLMAWAFEITLEFHLLIYFHTPALDPFTDSQQWILLVSAEIVEKYRIINENWYEIGNGIP